MQTPQASASLPTFRQGVHCTKALHPLMRAVCALRCVSAPFVLLKFCSKVSLLGCKSLFCTPTISNSSFGLGHHPVLQYNGLERHATTTLEHPPLCSLQKAMGRPSGKTSWLCSHLNAPRGQHFRIQED